MQFISVKLVESNNPRQNLNLQGNFSFPKCIGERCIIIIRVVGNMIKKRFKSVGSQRIWGPNSGSDLVGIVEILQ